MFRSVFAVCGFKDDLGEVESQRGELARTVLSRPRKFKICEYGEVRFEGKVR